MSGKKLGRDTHLSGQEKQATGVGGPCVVRQDSLLMSLQRGAREDLIEFKSESRAHLVSKWEESGITAE